MASGQRLTELRACMRNERNVKEPLAAYIILTDDAHQVSRNLTVRKFVDFYC